MSTDDLKGNNSFLDANDPSDTLPEDSDDSNGNGKDSQEGSNGSSNNSIDQIIGDILGEESNDNSTDVSDGTKRRLIIA